MGCVKGSVGCTAVQGSGLQTWGATWGQSLGTQPPRLPVSLQAPADTEGHPWHIHKGQERAAPPGLVTSGLMRVRAQERRKEQL